MKIKVGEYVRTKDGVIFKILTKDKSDFGNHYYGITDNENYSNYTYGKGSHNDIKNKILKHSFNIIDLIEENDIVGYRINCLSEFKVGRVKKYKDARNDKQYLGVESYDITKIYIDEILTHEQYKRNCYVVEEKNEIF